MTKKTLPMTPARVEHHPERSRFEATVDGLVSVADYRLAGGVLRMTHTGVPSAQRGRGIAAQLVAAALEHARREGLKVDPLCSYVRRYMQRHPQTQDLLAAPLA
ncbi:MAG: GNAT family N-acetyltransferase [Betaproteobacteria bacterium]